MNETSEKAGPVVGAPLTAIFRSLASAQAYCTSRRYFDTYICK